MDGQCQRLDRNDIGAGLSWHCAQQLTENYGEKPSTMQSTLEARMARETGTYISPGAMITPL